jgi:UPF0716 family protein affecting phage T7 exclusion
MKYLIRRFSEKKYNLIDLISIVLASYLFLVPGYIVSGIMVLIIGGCVSVIFEELVDNDEV